MINDQHISGRAIKRKRSIILLCFALLLLLPLFFIYFRLTAFHTFPFDNYYDYVLYLDGKSPYSVLGAPSGYRFVYYGTAFLLYKALPIIPLSNLPVSNNLDEIRAIQALAFASFLFIYAYFCTVFLLLRHRLEKSVGTSLAIACVSILLSWYTAPYGVDSLYLFYTALCLYFLKKPAITSILILFSPVVNEKIGIVFTFFYLGIFLVETGRKEVRLPLLTSILSIALYFFVRQWVNLPTGIYAYQTDVSMFWNRFQSSYPALVSLKGFYTNWIPLFILTIPAICCGNLGIFQKNDWRLHPMIGILPFFLFFVGILMCTDFTIGRIVMHALPFYAVPLCLLVEWLDK
jgi:hypothetical protein